MKALVSIIVPVYKVEPFIARCIQSVLTQTYPYWELLLVDDGSPDNSGVICDDYAAKDERIKVFHKSNGGVSSARNVGLDNAEGSWITFLDADDYWEPVCLEHCVATADRYELDILMLPVKVVYADGFVEEKEQKKTSPMSIEDFIKGEDSFGQVFNFYKACVIQQVHIRFDEKLKYLEDAFFLTDCLHRSQRVMMMGEWLYCYYKNPSGSNIPKCWEYYFPSMRICKIYKEKYPQMAVRIESWFFMLALRYAQLASKPQYWEFEEIYRLFNVQTAHNQSKRIKFFHWLMNINTPFAFFAYRALCSCIKLVKG